MIADALNHRMRAAVAHREPLAGHAAQKASPPVAPYNVTLPTMMFSSGTNVARDDGNTTSVPPDSPFPK